MADTYWDDSWGERLPFLEAAPEEEKKEKKELSPAEKELIEQCLDIIHSSVLED